MIAYQNSDGKQGRLVASAAIIVHRLPQITPITLGLATAEVRENNLCNLWIIPLSRSGGWL